MQVSGLFTDCSEDNRKVLLMRRLYDNGQDPIKLLPAASRDPHAVRPAFVPYVCPDVSCPQQSCSTVVNEPFVLLTSSWAS